jgi:molybdate transport system substrate-binding protein
VLALLSGLLLACGPAAAPAPTAAPANPASKPSGPISGEVTVFAAASLTDAFQELGDRFQAANPNSRVAFNFGASTQLRTQLEQGAQADVFAAADQAQMDRARQAGRIVGADTTFVTNRLVVIAPAANPGGVQGPADLAKPNLKVVTAQPEVPIGVYTQTMFERMSQLDVSRSDFSDRANANVVSREPNVRQVVAKIQLGEGDAAVVYLSDVTPNAAPDLQTIAVPDELNTIATYPIALVANAAQAELGVGFIGLVLSPTGQGILQKWNFSPIGPTATTPSAPAARPLMPMAQAGEPRVAP